MSSKRKWDQAAPEVDSEQPSKATKTEDAKSASEAAATAAAIAAKIAAQFANGGTGGGGKDPYDGDFTHDIDINDLRNRYLLTRGSTQQQVRTPCFCTILTWETHRFLRAFAFCIKIHEETGASVSTKGTWYPDRSKATDRDPPLYLHIAANTEDILQKAIAKVRELIDTDLGSLVEDKKDRQRERVRSHVLNIRCQDTYAYHSANGPRRSSPSVSSRYGILMLGRRLLGHRLAIWSALRYLLLTRGSQGVFVKYIQQETQTRVQIKGIGSGFVDQETGREADEPMYIHVTFVPRFYAPSRSN